MSCDAGSEKNKVEFLVISCFNDCYKIIIFDLMNSILLPAAPEPQDMLYESIYQIIEQGIPEVIIICQYKDKTSLSVCEK